MTQCQCEHPGWCVRHQCEKHAHWHHLCQTNQAYFDAWEAGLGPGQPVITAPNKPPESRPVSHEGLGDSVAGILKSWGITEERYRAVKELFGLPPTCGCDKRREWLNKVGRWWTGEE